MSVGRDETYGPRSKWFRLAYGQPWAYAAHDATSARGFFMAIGLKNTAKGFTRENGSFKPDLQELIGMATTMGYDETTARAVGMWLHSGYGDRPPPPPGITPKSIPFPKNGIPAGAAEAEAPAALTKTATLKRAISAEPAEIARMKELAADLVLEAAENGQPLGAKALALVRAVRNLSAMVLMALLGTTALGEAGVEPARSLAGSRDFKSLASEEDNDEYDEEEDEQHKRLTKPEPIHVDDRQGAPLLFTLFPPRGVAG